MQKPPNCHKCSGAFVVKDGGRTHKRPLLLTCGHTFCETCLLGLAKETRTAIHCPKCREETDLPNGESGVKLLCEDRYMVGTVLQNQKTLLELELAKLKELSRTVTQKKKNTEDMCRECCKRQAVSYCGKCDCNLCSICFTRVHNMSKSLMQHQAMPIEEVSLLECSQMCKTHETRPIEYFCEDDQMIICSRCVIVGNHKGHNISSLEDKNRLIVSEMEPNLQVANLVFKKLKKIDKELNTLVPDCQREIRPVLHDLRAHFHYLHGLLQVREHELERHVLQVSRQQLKPLEDLKDELEKEFKMLDITIKSAQRVMNNNDEVIVNAKEILEKLIHARDIPCIIERTDDWNATDRIIFNAGTPVDALLLHHGEIAEKDKPRYKVHTYREQPEKFSLEELDSQPSTPVFTPLDSLSLASDTTSRSDDIIIEEEQEILLGDDGEHVQSRKVQPKGPQPTLPKKAKFKGQNENVSVTHIHSPNKFVVQLQRESSRLTTMSYAIQRWCNSPAANKHMVTEVDVDDFVLAKYSVDKQWYRGRIKHVIQHDMDDFSKTVVEVAFIDFGNVEQAEVERLRMMQSKFMKHPEFSIECCLVNLVPKDKDGTWSVEAVQTFAKMVDGKTMLLTVVQEEGGVLMVDLSKPADEEIADDRPISVRDALVFLDLANVESPYSLPEPGAAHAPKRNYLTPNPKDEGESYPVIVSYAGTPDRFYIQELGEEANYLATMMAHLQDTYAKQNKDSWQIIYPQIGMICVSQFSSDGMWYRARVIELPGNKDVVVHYVDYGNTERVSFFNIRKILDSFLILPAQAIPCCLKDVAQPEEGWTNECLQFWSDLVTMQKFVMKVISVESVLGVVLRDPNIEDMYHSINISLVEKDMADSTGRWSAPQNMTELQSSIKEVVPRLSYQTSGTCFPEPCDMDHQPVYWKSRNSKPTRRYEETKLTPPTSPVPLRKSRGQRSGNSDQGPGQRSKRPQKGREQDREEGSSASSGSATPVGRSPRKEVKPKVKSPTSRRSSSSSEKKKKKMVSPDIEVKMTHFVSPSEFYLQRAEAGKQGLDQLMQDMNKAFQNTEPEWLNLKKGSFCVAFSTSMGRWYRAKVKKVLHKTLMEVYMIDYGFSEVLSVSNLRATLRQFRLHPSYAFASKLYGVLPAGGMSEWSRTACEFMEDQICNKKLFLLKRDSPEDGKVPIDLVYEEYVQETALEPGIRTFHSIIDRLKEQGLAIPMPKKLTETTKEEKVFPVLYFKKAEAEVKTGDKVMPVYVDFDAVIHCYTMEGDDLFQSMCDSLQQKFKYSDPHGPEQKWIKGQACVAFYEKDQAWHRAAILEVDPEKVKINFIDYGNSEWVGYECLRADIEEFTHIPQQTFLCTLHDIRPVVEDSKWDTAVLEMMHRDLVNKYCIITVVEKLGYASEHMTVHLEIGGKDYGSRLVQFGLAQRGEYITDQEIISKQIQAAIQAENPFKRQQLASAAETVDVLVTHMELPNVVYVQNMRLDISPDMSKMTRTRREANNDQLNKLEMCQHELNTMAPTLTSIPSPKIGMACCAKFKMDQCWYRALIVDILTDNNLILVHFVDYGNSEYVRINKLRALPQSLMSLPCQSHACILANLQPPNNISAWTKLADYHMREACISQTVSAHVKSVEPTTVELYLPENDEETLVYQSVIDKGYILYTVKDHSNPTTPVLPETQYVETRNVGKSPVQNVDNCIEHIQANDAISVKSSSAHCEQNLNNRKAASLSSANSVSSEQSVTMGVQSNMVYEFNNEQSESSSALGDSESLSKSWAEMAEEGSTLDYEELPEFETDSERSEQEPIKRASTLGKRELTVAGIDNLNAGAGKTSIQTNINIDKCAEGSLKLNSKDEELSSGEINLVKGGETEVGRKRGKLSEEERKRVKEERRKNREGTKVESVQHDDECFE
ncbi:RING finger protein 17-like [Mya arenaria]|uniref:RING finger protein 17-like n=1 Tax=Mya arenaria TaxID=6604 RepID=UPI0022E34A2F|nr:RING finger protein 17-like [Mya arenaria]